MSEKRPGGGARDCNAATQSEANLAWLSSGAASGLRPLLVNRPELWKFPCSNQERWHKEMAFPSNEVDLLGKIKALASASRI